MKNRKLNLEELQIESFITSFESGQDGTVKGGRFKAEILSKWCDLKNTQNVDDCGTVTIKTKAAPC